MAIANCSSLSINVNDLLQLQGVETQRVEFKKAWHSKGQGGKRGTYWQVVHSICAFANDFYNDNGGYIIIGVEEKEDWENDASNRQIILPPLGVPAKDLDRIHKEITGACRANIKPEYVPILSTEVVEMEGTRKHVLVIWAIASDNRPHKCRDSSEKEENRSFSYYIRCATETKKASPDEELRLLSLHAKIPFDDRRAFDSGFGKQLSEGDIDFALVKRFLKGIKSKLYHQEDKNPTYFYERLKLVRHIGDRRDGDMLVPVWAPRNVALLFFHQAPHDFFSGAKTEIAIYTHEDYVPEEKLITGPIDQQIEETLSFILTTTKEEAGHEFVAYPSRALREAVVNAFHHRGYEESDNNPIKIHIKPHCIEVISYPGPDPTLKPEDFSEGNEVPCVPSRNRRIAEFLKERQLAEGRFTGVRTIYKSMKKNNNPKPSFDFNQSYFRVRLPGHPKYIAYSIRREVDNLCAKGDKNEAIKSLKGFLDEHLTDDHSFWGSEMLISKLLELNDNDINHPNIQPYKHFISEKMEQRMPLITKLCKWCVSDETTDIATGVEIVKKLVKEGARYEDLDSVVRKAVDLCIEKNEKGQRVVQACQNAHKLFEAMGELTQTNGYVAYQFAFCKFNLYCMQAVSTRKRRDLIGYLKDAEDYINRAIQLTNEDYKHHLVNQYRQLGYIHSQLEIIHKSTEEQIVAFYEKARKYNPKIEINQLFVPPGYQFRDMGSPTSRVTSLEWSVSS